MITMEELQGYPVADDKDIRDAHNKAISLIEHNVDEFFDCFPGANSENNFYRQTENTDWTEGFWTGELWLIIDCLMNMPLLFWASKVTGDKKYAEKAQAHIKTAMENIVRDDNSTYHTYFFDMETGKPTKGVTCQGNRDGSAWARGQAWGIYGSAVAYSKTGNKEYLDIFKRVTKYFMEHLPKDLVPYWDFDFDTGSDEPRDSSSGVIAVCGMLEMAKYLDKDEAEYYTQTAKRLLKAIIDNCAVKDSKESNGLLLHGTYAKKTPYNTCNNGGVDECNTWGDYFYMEALTRLTSDWNPYW